MCGDDNVKEVKDLVKVKNVVDNNDKSYYSFTIDKEIGDKTFNALAKAADNAFDKVGPNIGAGAAAGTAAGLTYKTVAGSGLPPVQKAAAVAYAAVRAAGTKLGLDSALAIKKNINWSEVIKSSPHADSRLDSIPSWSGSESKSEVLSVLEDENIPLIDLLENLFTLNVLELLLFIVLIFYM